MKQLLVLVLVLSLVAFGCTKVVTIPDPTPLPAVPNVDEKVKAVAASNIDPTQRPVVIQTIEQTAKDEHAADLTTHNTEYNALLARAQDAEHNATTNLDKWITAIFVTCGLGSAIAAWINRK
jgi:hypothetical protein